ncbi:MAG TPA: S1C family serine protease [Burkholderiales bacterium]|nr:S1C family serine protease [Burkholderiales bacterium]
MTTDLLEQFSGALAARAEAVRGAIAAIRISDSRHLSATLWQPDVAVASEQSLPRGDEFELVVAGGSTVKAKLAGRDPGTNIAALRLDRALDVPALVSGEAKAGALALAYGADGAGGVRARMGVVNTAGPEWASSAGGRIDRYIVLDLSLARAEEGGPVLDAAGARLGISTFGPRGRVLVIPSATIERVLPELVKAGRIARGWLGVGLQPVAVPDALQEQAGQSSGAMVMSLAAGGPAAKAGIVAGDIVLTVNGKPARSLRRLAGELAAVGIGRATELRLIRGGMVMSLQATIEARPA